MTDPTTPAQVDLDELEALAKAATPGPWMSLRDGNQYIETSYLPTAKGVGASRIPEITRPWNPHAYVRFGFRPTEFETARFKDADADFIAAMNPAVALALIAEVRAHRERWVSVSDELPDSDEPVLVSSDEGACAVAELEFTDDSEGRGEPYWAVLTGGLSLANYPHWMPLPAPPVVKEPTTACPHGASGPCMKCDLKDVAETFGCPKKEPLP